MIIYAVNIHTGGGKVLLDELIENETFGKVSAAFLDPRYPLPAGAQFPVFRTEGKLWGRFKAEIQLHHFLKTSDATVLFFGNIPPFFKPKNQSYLYLQNCFLTRQVPLPRDSHKEMLRNWLESVLLQFFAKNVSEIWVQTAWMKRMTLVLLPKAKVQIKAFLPHFKKVEILPQVFDFLFVGSLSLNKRFSFFVEALKELDQKLDRSIQVAIVLDQQPLQVQNLQFKNIQISLSFRLNRDDLAKIYAQSKVFVSTALNESFGLPLYEAHSFKCEVIAPISGYTEDLPFSARLFETHSPGDLTQKMLKTL